MVLKQPSIGLVGELLKIFRLNSFLIPFFKPENVKNLNKMYSLQGMPIK